MTKPRIFINMHYMALGGAERALLGLLNALDPERVDVDLFLNQHTGEFMPLIPKHVNLLPERKGYNAIERPMKDVLKEGQFGVLYGRLKAKWQHGRYHNSLNEPYKSFDSSVFQYVADCVDPHLPPLGGIEGGQEPYDLAISFLQPHNIVLNKVKAKKKIAWIHTDYSMVHFNSARELPVWSRFDNIVSISPDCTRSFLKTFP
jgi:glycosyltransferase involved in cell wall biosynthesis